jgi:hypothetical protein
MLATVEERLDVVGELFAVLAGEPVAGPVHNHN